MKRYLFSCILALAFCICAAQDRQAVLKVLQTQQQAWNKGDVDGFMQGYWKSDSLVFVGKTAPAYGWQTTLDHYKKSYPDKAAMGQLTFTITKVDVMDPNNAFVLGSWSLKREK